MQIHTNTKIMHIKWVTRTSLLYPSTKPITVKMRCIKTRKEGQQCSLKRPKIQRCEMLSPARQGHVILFSPQYRRNVNIGYNSIKSPVSASLYNQLKSLSYETKKPNGIKCPYRTQRKRRNRKKAKCR